MKYLLTCALVLVMVAGISFASGGEEAAEVHKLTWFITGDVDIPEGMEIEGWTGQWREYQIYRFMEENPNTKVTIFPRDVSQGSMTLDSLMAAGKPPDVLTDAAWLFPNYLVPEFALPLEEYMDLSRFQDNMIDLYSRDGHCYAIVQDNVTIGFALNLDMLKPIGYAVPAQPDWTTVEFDRLSEKLKAVDMYSTVIMTQNGLDAWGQMWAQNAGGTMYENNDYSKVTMNTPEYAVGLKYMKSLVDRGYAYPRPNECNDDTGIEDFAVAKIFACTLQTGHVTGWVKQALESGALEKPFEYTYVEVPHSPTVEHSPIDGYQSITLGHRSKNEERNKAIAKFIESQFTDEYVTMYSAQGAVPTVKGFVPTKGLGATSGNLAMLALAQSAPPLDSGRLLPQRRAIYRAWTPYAQDFMNGGISAEDLLDILEIEANKLLAE